MNAPRTISFWGKIQSGIGNGWAGIGWGKGFENYERFCWGVIDGCPCYSLWGYEKKASTVIPAGWHHHLLDYSPSTGTVRIFMDNIEVLSDSPA